MLKHIFAIHIRMVCVFFNQLSPSVYLFDPLAQSLVCKALQKNIPYYQKKKILSVFEEAKDVRLYFDGRQLDYFTSILKPIKLFLIFKDDALWSWCSHVLNSVSVGIGIFGDRV